jgi:hypothetical protein
MKEFRYIGTHADELEGGRPLAPGDYTGPINEKAKKNKQLIDEGHLIPIEDGTTARVEALDLAAMNKGEPLTTDEWQQVDKSPKKAETLFAEKKGVD